MLMGYDNNGTVFDNGDHISRIIIDDYKMRAKEIFKIYEKHGLNTLGIVETEMENDLFKHKKYLITYPYEWTSNMYKDALLFHLELLVKLDDNDLILKDFLLNNVVFCNTQPKFIDFLSLINRDDIINEKWLTEGGYRGDIRFAIIEKMLIPYALIPFMAMVFKDYKLARILLTEKICNCNIIVPEWSDLLVPKQKNWLKVLVKKILNLDARRNRIRSFTNIEKKDFIASIKSIKKLINESDVTPPSSGYTDYYELKNEKLDFDDKSEWKHKQLSVYNIIENSKPESVLDIGANTGWNSRLAEHLGAEVIALDIDESAIDNLYLHSKKHTLKITSLLIPFDNLELEIYGRKYDSEAYKDKNFDHYPLYMAATERLACDLVMVLALLHHLILGEGKELNYIFKVLRKLTKKTLILEFVDLEDEMIKNEPNFFGNLNRFNRDNYNLDLIVKSGLLNFNSVQVMESHPETRKLLIFT